MLHRVGAVYVAALVVLGLPVEASSLTAMPPTSGSPKDALSGTVKGPDGKPVAGARVIAKPSRHWAEPLATTTGDAGRFSLPVPPKLGPWDVRVEAPGLAAAQLERVTPGAALEVRLTRGRTLTGVVRDGRDGRPLSGVRVEARARASWAFGGSNDPTLGLVWARTDREGRFRILGVGLGFFDVEAKAAGYGAAKRPEVAAGATVEMLLFPAASIAGVVLGPGRRPVPGALVAAERQSGPASPMGPVLTDARGRFLIAGVEPGSYVVKARHPDLAPGRRDVEVAALSEAQVEVELASGVAATGRLTDGQGRPVRGRVTLLEFGAPPWNLPLAPQPNVGADGRFAVAHVPAGEHAIAVQAPGYAFHRVPIEVGPRDAGIDLGEVVLDRGAALSGRVTDPAGAPIEGATVSAYSAAPHTGKPEDFKPAEPTRTASDGAFLLSGLTEGRQRLSVSAPGFAPLQANVDTGSNVLNLVLVPGGTLTGIVADTEGRPLDTFRVDPQSLDGEADRFGQPQFIDVASPDGRFTFEGLPEGTYSVRAEAPEWAPGDVSNLEVSGGRTTDAGVIRLGRGGIVRGVAVDGGGAAVAGATVSVGPSGIWRGHRGAETQSAVDGRFEIRGLAPGRVVVRATHPAYATSVKTGVDVDLGKEPADVKLVLSAGGRILGVAKMRDETPLAGANVWVTPERLTEEAPFLHDGGGHARVEADGSFLVERLPHGPVTVRLASPRDGPFLGDLEQEARVVDGETTTVAFIVREILVTGRVTRAGAGVPKLRVTVNAGEMPGAPYVPKAPPAGVGPQPLTGVTRDDGSYELLVFETGPSTGLVSSLDGAVRYAARQGTVPDADRFELDFTLRGVPVTGVVVDKDTGEVLEHAQVGLRTKEGREGGNARSGSDGRFSFEVEPGDYVFAVGVDGYAFVEGERDVGPAGLVDWRVEMARGQKLHGRVVDAAGRAAPGVPLLAFATGAMGLADFTVSSDDGGFRFDRLQAAPCDVAAASPLGIAIRRDASPGERDVLLTLSPAGRIHLTIVDGQGVPVANARARVAALDGRSVLLPLNTPASDAAGALELAAPLGTVEVEAEKDGRGGRITVTVEGGATAATRVVLGEASRKP